MFILVANMFILCQIFSRRERKTTVCEVNSVWN